MSVIPSKVNTNSPVYIVDGLRTPFLKANPKNTFTAADLGVAVGKALLLRQNFSIESLDEVITGCVIPSAKEANISRIIALRLGCDPKTTAWTVQRNCASGLQALDCAYQSILTGRSDLILAGGTESMSHAPLLASKSLAKWLGQWVTKKKWLDKINLLTQIKASDFKLSSALLKGLTDPVVGLSMGQTAEDLAYQFHIKRQVADELAWQSHQRALLAYENGYFSDELTSLYDSQGYSYESDEGIRKDTDIAKLGKLKPIFDNGYGIVTAGNSSQISDGAAYLILASKAAVKKYNLPVKAKIIDCHWAGLAPEKMGLGPVHAIAPLLKRHQLMPEDIDCYEINEAFSAQVLACLAAWEDDSYCQQHLSLNKKWGEFPKDKLNIDGGAIALGHPIGASGARLVLHLTSLLNRQKGRLGIAALCIGGGQGGAMLIERITKEEV